MAAYAATVTSDMPKAVALGGMKIGIYAGTVDVTNYNQTNAAITGITGKFRTVISVSLGISDNGYLGLWGSSSVKCFKEGDVGGAMVQLASDVDAGAFNFIAVGII